MNKVVADTSRPIVGLGDLAADIVVQIPAFPFEASEVHVSSSLRLEPGGTGNFLIATARLGAPACAVGSVGVDMWGTEVRRLLDAEGVDLAGVVDVTESTTVLSVVDDHGDHGFIGRFGTSARIDSSATHGPSPSDAAVLFVSGYALQEPEMASAVLDAFAVASPDTWRVLDPGPTFDRVDPDLARRCLAHTDIVMLTNDELAAAFSGSISAALGRGPRYVVLKRGAAGCVVHDANGVVADVGGHPVIARDTAAAGDSFAAGFAVGLRRGWSLPDCAALANAVGVAKVQKVGTGRSVPTLAEVQHVLDQFSVAIDL